MSEPMLITLDRDRCVGAGQCVLAAPELFDQADDGLSLLRDRRPPPELHDAARTAGYRCPARAIAVHSAC